MRIKKGDKFNETFLVSENIYKGFISIFKDKKNVIIHTQEIKYHRPVYINDKLSFYAEVMNMFDELNVIEIKFFFNNQDCLKVASGKFQIGVI